jgi:hypothetical protein
MGSGTDYEREALRCAEAAIATADHELRKRLLAERELWLDLAKWQRLGLPVIPAPLPSNEEDRLGASIIHFLELRQSLRGDEPPSLS